MQHQQQRPPQLGMHGGGAAAGPSNQHMAMSMGVNGPVNVSMNDFHAHPGGQQQGAINGDAHQAPSPFQRNLTPQQQQHIMHQQQQIRGQQQRQIALNQQQQQQQQAMMAQAQESQRRAYPMLVHPTPGTLANANGGPVSASATTQPIGPVQAGLLRPQSQQSVQPQQTSPHAIGSNNPSPNSGQGYLPPRAVSAAASHFAQQTSPYAQSPANTVASQQTPQRMAMAPPKVPASASQQQLQHQQQQQYAQHQQQIIQQQQHMQNMQRFQHQQALQQNQQQLQREQALRAREGQLAGGSVVGWTEATDSQHPLLQPGAGVLRLLEWSAVMIKGPDRSDLSYWRDFTNEFFVDGGGMSYTLAADEDSLAEKLFDIPASILPRWYQSLYTSGLVSITFSLPACSESLVPVAPPSPGQAPSPLMWHGICVECPNASWTYHYPDGCRVICEGSIQAVLVPVDDDSCLRFEYVDLVTSSFDELLPRPRPEERAASLKVKLEMNGTLSPENGEASMDTLEGRTVAKTPVLERINAYGLTNKAVRCLEIAESLDLMRDLFAVTSSEAVGPTTILARAAQPQTINVLNAEYPPQPYPPVERSPDQGDDSTMQEESSHSSSITVATPVAHPTPAAMQQIPTSNEHYSIQPSPPHGLVLSPSSATASASVAAAPGSLKRKQQPDASTELEAAAESQSPTKRSAISPSPVTRTRRALRSTPLA